MKASGKQSEMQILLQPQGVCAFREPAHTDSAHSVRMET